MTMEKKISSFRRIVYIFFGLSGIAGIVATGFWLGNVISTIFHTTVLIAAVNWGVLGITGKDILEWIEIVLEKIF
jgi:uncharacterized membrane protein YuzA (DUF378 family)